MFCNIVKCDKRHPRICKYQRDYGRCKFMEYCRFNHDKQNDVSQNSEKIVSLENKISKMEERISKNCDNENLAKNVEKKLEVFENQMKHLREVIDEKDNVIVDLKRKIECFEKSKAEEYEEIKKQNVELETSIKELQINIMKLNEKLSDFEERPLKCNKSNVFNDSSLDETIENLETSVKELKKVILKCEKCKFTTESNSRTKDSYEKKAHKFGERKIS